MRSLLIASEDCIKVIDLDGNLAFMSEGGQRVMEVSDFNAIKGCPWPDFWAGQGNVDAGACDHRGTRGAQLPIPERRKHRRVVHGGDGFTGPVRLENDVVDAIEALTPLAPLHQPLGLRLIKAITDLHPGVPQTASFDTAFHRGHADIVRRFAIPRALHDQGIKRYGFHGLSYKFIASELGRRQPEIAGSKVVVAHLGSGASLCGLHRGLSQDTSMGFSALDGVPMATRCGAIDPGVLLHLMGTQGRTVQDVEDILYRQSGLLGVSGISADIRELLDSERPQASQALDLFSFRIAGEIARLATTLGGLDAIVFTAGVGENQPRIRAGVSARLAWLGLMLDEAANEANAGTISSASSAISALVIATDEEQVIADEALFVLGVEGTGL